VTHDLVPVECTQVERNRPADHPGADVMRAYEEPARAMRAVD
jgi:hypothetical protein